MLQSTIMKAPKMRCVDYAEDTETLCVYQIVLLLHRVEYHKARKERTYSLSGNTCEVCHLISNIQVRLLIIINKVVKQICLETFVSFTYETVD